MSALVPFRPLQTNDSLLTRIQSNISSALAPVTACALLNGAAFNVVFATANSDVTVNAAGTWLIGGQTAAGSVYLSPSHNQSPSTSTILRASAPMTATLWFFAN